MLIELRAKAAARLMLTLTGLACAPTSADVLPSDFEVTARFPHDTTAYTQGLIWDDSVLYESTGRYAHSELRRVELVNGLRQGWLGSHAWVVLVSTGGSGHSLCVAAATQRGQ